MEEIYPEDLILVAVMNSPRDLEIARVLGWYRIPLQTAPKTVRVDWIAFFLTAAFTEKRWSVRYMAKVVGHELLTRGELLREEREHPRADEPYFKLLLGPVLELPRPIPAEKWRRFTFLYTTGERLARATDVQDLRVPPSNARDRLWKLIHDRVDKGDGFGIESRQEDEADLIIRTDEVMTEPRSNDAGSGKEKG